jgi:biotin carboxyl carrier protein
MRYFVSLAQQRHCIAVTADDGGYRVEDDRGARRVSVVGSDGAYRVHVGERVIDLTLRTLVASEPSAPVPLEVHTAQGSFHAEIASERDAVSTSTQAASNAGRRPIAAHMPGKVLQVRVGVGDRATRGQALLVMEAMKMENELYAPADLTVVEVLIRAGDTVEAGAPLLIVE